MSDEDGDDAGPADGGLRLATLGLGLVGVAVLAAGLWALTMPAKAQAGSSANRGHGARFSSFIDDLPIMPGLTEDDRGYAYVLHQGGRLAEARLAGEADPSVIRGFYAATLTQLGWRPTANEPYVYLRDDERLLFLVEPRRARSGARGHGTLEAVFVITPAPGSPSVN